MNMTLAQGILTVAAVVLGTMTTRFLPFLLFPEGKRIPAFLRYLGSVLPFAVIGMLVVYCLKDASFTAPPFALPELLGVLAAGALHLWKKNMFLSILGGTLLYMLLIRVI